jgi:Fe-Mn family superoxide dismutase
VINTAPDRTKALAFNYASEALNNSFYLDFLVRPSDHSASYAYFMCYILQKPPPPSPAQNHEDDISPYLGTAIRDHEGSVVQLKSKFSATVMGMSSSGYVWFVTDQSGVTAVIPTYGSGTLLARSRMQQTPVEGLVLGESIKVKRGLTKSTVLSNSNPSASTTSDLAATSPTSGLSHSSPPLKPSSPSRAFYATPTSSTNYSVSSIPSSIYSNPSAIGTQGYSEGFRFDLTTLGETLYPLFCIGVHERAWLTAGYGVWGKEEWLKQFWTVLDWRKVSDAYTKWIPDNSTRL